jgi:hypothetical protein
MTERGVHVPGAGLALIVGFGRSAPVCRFSVERFQADQQGEKTAASMRGAKDVSGHASYSSLEQSLIRPIR